MQENIDFHDFVQNHRYWGLVRDIVNDLGYDKAHTSLVLSGKRPGSDKMRNKIINYIENR